MAIAVNLVAAERAGRKVIIVDLDAQVSASNLGDRRERNDPEKITLGVISIHSTWLPQLQHKRQ